MIAKNQILQKIVAVPATEECPIENSTNLRNHVALFEPRRNRIVQKKIMISQNPLVSILRKQSHAVGKITEAIIPCGSVRSLECCHPEILSVKRIPSKYQITPYHSSFRW